MKKKKRRRFTAGQRLQRRRMLKDVYVYGGQMLYVFYPLISDDNGKAIPMMEIDMDHAMRLRAATQQWFDSLCENRPTKLLHYAGFTNYMEELVAINEERTLMGRPRYIISFAGFLTKRFGVKVPSGKVLKASLVDKLIVNAELGIKIVDASGVGLDELQSYVDQMKCDAISSTLKDHT